MQESAAMGSLLILNTAQGSCSGDCFMAVLVEIVGTPGRVM